MFQLNKFKKGVPARTRSGSLVVFFSLLTNVPAPLMVEFVEISGNDVMEIAQDGIESYSEAGKHLQHSGLDLVEMAVIGELYLDKLEDGHYTHVSKNMPKNNNDDDDESEDEEQKHDMKKNFYKGAGADF